MDKKICATCSSEPKDTKLRTCGNCKKIRYCSVECQRKGWSEHKGMCIILEGKIFPKKDFTFIWRNYRKIFKEYYFLRKNNLVPRKKPITILVNILDYDEEFEGENKLLTSSTITREEKNNLSKFISKGKLAKTDICLLYIFTGGDEGKISEVFRCNIPFQEYEKVTEIGYKSLMDFETKNSFSSIIQWISLYEKFYSMDKELQVMVSEQFFDNSFGEDGFIVPE